MLYYKGIPKEILIKMLIERLVNGDYTHAITIKIKKNTALILINEQLEAPIAKTTMVANALKVKALIDAKKVPEMFLGADFKKNSQDYSFYFLILLTAYLKEVDDKKQLKESPTKYGSQAITDSMINRVDLDLLIKTLKNGIPVQGKNLSIFFALENIKVGKSTLYTLSKIYPELPTMNYGKMYTPEEIDQWRQFLLNRKYQHHFQKEREIAL